MSGVFSWGRALGSGLAVHLAVHLTHANLGAMMSPRYFPVKPAPLLMRAGLFPLGVDLGNGPLDHQYFQRDAHFRRYQQAKREVADGRHSVVSHSPPLQRAHEAALHWCAAQLAHEHGDDAQEGLDPARPLWDRWQRVNRLVQEDFALLHRGQDDHGAAIAVFVSFPSGWRPERLKGASFFQIHEPVPDFADRELAAQSMVRAMVERGPYVRFVWTVSADDHLDHHPEEGRRAPLADATQGFLRVERQVTVPFPDVDASLFLIRTYLTPFAELSRRERATLAEAIQLLPEPIARYKGLFEGRPRMLELLGAGNE